MLGSTSTTIVSNSPALSLTSFANKGWQENDPAKPTFSKHAGSLPQIMRLPLEIRRQIYYYLIPQHLNVDLHDWRRKRSLLVMQNENDRIAMMERQHREANFWTPWLQRPLSYGTCPITTDIANSRSNCQNSALLLCRQISSDILDALYGDNIFIFRLHDTTGMPNVNAMKRNAARIRRAEVTISHAGGPKGQRFDEELWSLLLPGLLSLKIIVNQPEPRTNRSKVELQMEMDRWLNWILAVFRQFASYLSCKTLIEIEAEDGRLEITDLLKEYLPVVKGSV